MERQVEEIEKLTTESKNLFQLFIKALAIFIALYHLYCIVTGKVEPFLYRFTHLSLALLLGFLLSASKKNGLNRWFPSILGIATFLIYLYFYLNYERLIVSIPGLHRLTNWDKIIGITLIILILESARRYIGWILPLVCIVFLVYLFAGQYLPGILYYKGLSIDYIIHYLVYTFEGIFGSAIAVSSGYIVLFLIFGNFLNVSGVGEYFINLATALAGGTRGGPAKIAVLSSAFIGTIIGAPTANVVITGTFTIPLMLKKGFQPDFSAGVEAAASTGGMILPPIMGSTAFIMADILGITYLQVAKAALIPAIIYFLAILIMVDFYAAKHDICGLPKKERPSRHGVLKQSYKLLPLVVIIILLIKGYSPAFAGIGGLLASIILGIFSIKKKKFFKKALEALEKASITAVQLILACAISGIILGTFTLTGISGKITGLLLQSIGNTELLVLFFIMVSALILGMGLPVTPTYLLCVVWGAPALISLGFKPIAAHLFILFFAVLAPLTPPFAITSYVAANIAGGRLGRTAIQALFLASSGFIVPFMFIYHNELLMIGNWPSILISFFKLIISIVCLAGGIQGFLLNQMNIFSRMLVMISGILVILPGFLSDFFGLFLLGILLILSKERTSLLSNNIKTFFQRRIKDL